MRAFTLLLFLLAFAAPAPAVDTIVVGGTIYTLEGERASPVEALALDGGQVVAAGTRGEMEALAGDDTRRIDLQGAFAMPGLVDAHGHLSSLGKLLQQVDLRETASAEDCLARLRDAERSLPEGAWLRGRGWDQNDWPTAAYPTRRLLDEAFGERPVYLRRVDGHAGWVNGAALRAAGFDRDTPDPQGGEILRDPESGEPTGILIDAADDSLRSVIPPPHPAERELRWRKALEAVARAGLSGVHEMGVGSEDLAVLERAEREGWLGVRVVVYLNGDEVLAEFPQGPRRGESSERLRVEGVKLYADGALGSRGAALLEDYHDRPGHRGLLIQSPEELRAQVGRALDRSFSVAIHAIGDRGNRVALDALERAHAARPTLPPLSTLRCRVEHAQVLHPDDLPRFARLGVIASMQPTHCTSDMPWAPERLGEDRLPGAYAWRSLRETGCWLPLGSDFPVESHDPRRGLYAARTRQTPEGTPVDGWSPEQRLGALEALLGFTSWAAKAAGVSEWGTLGVGQRADLTVLSGDPLDEDPTALLRARPLLTMVEGEVVWEAEDRGR